MMWRLIHHCVAHPLLAIGEAIVALAGRLHDWTGARAFPDDGD